MKGFYKDRHNRTRPITEAKGRYNGRKSLPRIHKYAAKKTEEIKSPAATKENKKMGPLTDEDVRLDTNDLIDTGKEAPRRKVLESSVSS